MDKKKIREILSQDLLERNGEAFTFERKENRLGWEKTIPAGSGYSSYVTDAKDDEELLRKAFTLAKEMISAMDTPFKVRVRLNQGEGAGSYTDFKQVAVATSCLDDKSISIGQRLDCFLGFAVHEACHLLYTDPSGLSSDSLVRDIENILEDERIENLCGKRTPGLVKFIASAKYHSFDGYVEKHPEVYKTPNAVIRMVNSILAYVRYPKSLSSEMIDEFGETLLKVREILTPFPASTREVGSCAKKIADLIRKEAERLKKEAEERRSGADKSEGGSGSSEGKSSSSDKKDEGKDGKGSSEKSSDKSSDEDSEKGPVKESSSIGGGSGKDGYSSESEDGEAESGASGKSDSSSSSSSAHGGSETHSAEDDALADADISKMLKELADAMGELSKTGRLDNEDVCDAVKADRYLNDECEGSLERGSSRDVHFKKASVTRFDAEAYDIHLKEVQKYVPAIRNILRNNGQELRSNLLGMRSGHFDCNKLADAYQGSQTVFRQQSVTKADNLAVCILLDESGSMSCDGRMPSARRTAVLLNEALSGIPGIDLYIYGHTADDDFSMQTKIYTYKEHGVGERKAVGSADARDNNRDGVAIREVAARVRSFTQDKCLFFVLSDGDPCAHRYSGYSAIRDTRRAVAEITAKGFVPVQIAISSEVEPSEMFDHFVKLTDLAVLPKELGKIIKEAILKNAVRRTA